MVGEEFPMRPVSLCRFSTAPDHDTRIVDDRAATLHRRMMDGDCACGTEMTDLPLLFPGRRYKKRRIQMIDELLAYPLGNENC